MANMCCVDFNIEFESGEKTAAFAEEFSTRIEKAASRNEGVGIAENEWLFDAILEKGGDAALTIRGWVKWGLESDSMAEFSGKLREAGMTSLECFYEECGNLIYGKYEYHDGELWNSYVDERHAVWDSAYDDDHYEKLDAVLETEGVLEMVA